MKMMILALASILCAHQLQAALGETELELIKRYGPVQGSFKSDTSKFSTDEFEHGGYHISVTFLDGLSSKEIYSRNDKKPMDEVQLQEFLDIDTFGGKWEKKDDNDNIVIWVLDTKKAFAGYYKKLNSLIVKTPDMLAFEEALLKVQQQQQQQQAHPRGTPDPKLKP